MSKEWEALRAWLEKLSEITAYSVDETKKEEAFEAIYQSMQALLDAIWQMLIQYETSA